MSEKVTILQLIPSSWKQYMRAYLSGELMLSNPEDVQFWHDTLRGVGVEYLNVVELADLTRQLDAAKAQYLEEMKIIEL